MDSRTFLGLVPSHNPFRWSMPVLPRLCTPGDFLFGGCGLGAAISAIEGTTNRELVWATGQYLDFAKPGEVLDLDVTVAVEGHQITQARAVCHVGDREVLTVNAALGERDFAYSGQWDAMPDVPPPSACKVARHPFRTETSIVAYMEERMVQFRSFADMDATPSVDGRTILWAKLPSVIDGVDAATLGVLGDFVPMGLSQALGIAGGGTSLDNTLRVAKLVPTEWVLLDIRMHAVSRGFGHGIVNMFAEDGTLLATASQSCVARMWKGPPP